MATQPGKAGERRRRSGGRVARRELRARPIAQSQAPVRAGLEGGWYQPLSEAGVAKIHDAAMTVLAEIGFADAIPSCIEACTARGAEYGDDGRLRMPRALVEDVISQAHRGLVLHGQSPRHDLDVQGKKVHFGTAGAAVHVVDLETRHYRESLLHDIYDAARIVETLDNIHFFQRPLVARDMAEPRDLDINTVYAAISGTTKHVGSSFTLPEHVDETLELLHLVAGGEAAWRERPFVSQSNCFVVPPLKFAEDACRCLEAAIRGGMPVLLLSAGQAGATAPVTIAGTIVQAIAEVLGGLVYVNAVRPGHPALLGPWPFVSDLRTGAMSGGSGEQAILSAACGQMLHFYALPGGSAAGMADSKMPDVQAGYEKGITDALAGLAGLNLVYESAGMMASLLGFSHEGLIIDNDMIGQCLRCVRGIEVSDDTLAIETIRQVCTEGPGHYLGHDQTLALMQSEYVYPAIGNRMSPKEWNEAGKPDIVAEATRRKEEILRTVFPDHIPAGLDDRIRSKFDIKLPRTQMLGK